VLRAVTSVLFYVGVAVAAWFLWPTTLGGCTSLTVVTGHSMEPTYYTGDLVVARCGAPHVGDVVVYRPSEVDAKARIVHRIIGGTSEGWTLQGDNNDYPDSFAPTDDDVLGIAKVHVPKVMLVWDALSSPYVWGGLILLALALAAWPRGDDEDEDGDDETTEDDDIEPEPLAADERTDERTDEPAASDDWDLVAGEPR